MVASLPNQGFSFISRGFQQATNESDSGYSEDESAADWDWDSDDEPSYGLSTARPSGDYIFDGIGYVVNHGTKTLRVVWYSGESRIPCTVAIAGEQYTVTVIGCSKGFHCCEFELLEIPDSVEILEGFATSRIARIHFSPRTTVKSINGF
jgi:hypothetical protein